MKHTTRMWSRRPLADRQGARGLVFAVFVAVIGALACDSRAQSSLPADLETPEGVPREALERAAATLTAALAETGPAGPVEFDVRDAGEGLYILRAVVPGSYPGTGVTSVVVDAEGVSYGEHGVLNLADLARARGWLAAPPATADLLMRLVDAAYFEGMGSTSLAEPGLVAGDDGLTLHFSQFTPPGPAFPWHVVIPAEGPARLYTVDNTGQSPDGLLQVR